MRVRRHVTDSLNQKRVAPDLVVRVDAAQRKTEARTKNGSHYDQKKDIEFKGMSLVFHL